MSFGTESAALAILSFGTKSAALAVMGSDCSLLIAGLITAYKASGGALMKELLQGCLRFHLLLGQVAWEQQVCKPLIASQVQGLPDPSKITPLNRSF